MGKGQEQKKFSCKENSIKAILAHCESIAFTCDAPLVKPFISPSIKNLASYEPELFLKMSMGKSAHFPDDVKLLLNTRAQLVLKNDIKLIIADASGNMIYMKEMGKCL